MNIPYKGQVAEAESLFIQGNRDLMSSGIFSEAENKKMLVLGVVILLSFRTTQKSERVRRTKYNNLILFLDLKF